MRGIQFLSVVVGLALGLVMGRASWAQPPMIPPGLARPAADNGNPLVVAMSPAVQRELKLSDEQKTKVFDLMMATSQKSREIMQSAFLSGGSDPRAMMMARNEIRKEMEQSLGQVFDKKQNKRFLEILLRSEGPLAVARPEVASRLGLSDNQSNQVQVVMMNLHRAQLQLLISMRSNGVSAGGQGLDRNAVNQFTTMSGNYRREAIQRISRVLSQKQKDGFNEMLGEPFDLEKLQSSDPNAPADAAKTDTKSAATKSEGATAAEADAPKDDDTKTEKPKTTARKKGRKTAPKKDE